MLLWIFKDGTFVVRDSSKGKAEHPYTLMVLKEGKVYNIKIRKQGSSFFLGSGLHNFKVNCIGVMSLSLQRKGLFTDSKVHILLYALGECLVLTCPASLCPCHFFCMCCSALEFPWGERDDYPSCAHPDAAH